MYFIFVENTCVSDIVHVDASLLAAFHVRDGASTCSSWYGGVPRTVVCMCRLREAQANIMVNNTRLYHRVQS